MQQDRNIFRALKTHILDNMPEIKGVRLWNSQISHLLRDKPDENPVLFPCVYIQMTPGNFKDLPVGIQEFDMEITTHLCFKTQITDDETILDLKEELYSTVHRFRFGNYSYLLRRDELPDFDHGNVLDYQTVYTTHGRDYKADKRNLDNTIYIDPVVSGVSITFSAVTNY